MLRSIAVFCGSSPGYKDIYCEQAGRLGMALAQKNIRLVYGGARVGVMGAVADGALAGGGLVTGVIPGFLKTKEIAHEGLSELITTENMHDRKMKMHELSDGIIALPGGWGTMEELFEMMTWAQLGLHPKPIGILNVGGFYDPLVQLIDTMVSEGFLKEIYRDMVILSEEVSTLLALMEAYKVPDIPKWITPETT